MYEKQILNKHKNINIFYTVSFCNLLYILYNTVYKYIMINILFLYSCCFWVSQCENSSVILCVSFFK